MASSNIYKSIFARIHLLSFLCTVFGYFTLGCFSSLQLEKIAAESYKPANVMVLLKATSNNHSVTDLHSESFTLREDQFPPTKKENFRITQPDLREKQYTALLLDFGDQPNYEEIQTMADATELVIATLSKSKHLGIFVLDGRDKPIELVALNASIEAYRSAVDKLRKLKPRDSSRDLYGSYISVLNSLQTATHNEKPPIANMVLVTRGPDRAARTTLEQLRSAIQAMSPHLSQWTIHIRKPGQPKLDRFTSTPAIELDKIELLPNTLNQIAETIYELGQSYYLVSYCAAARAGKDHQLRIEVKHTHQDEKGKSIEEWDSIDIPFSAEGFEAGCNPEVPNEWK